MSVTQTIYDSLTDGMKQRIKDFDMLNCLADFGVRNRLEFEKSYTEEFLRYDSPNRRLVGIVYAGMGHSNLIAFRF
jgi:hypothetical protein